MELTQAINRRRSVRNFSKEKAVPREFIEEMLTSALKAPSWKNSQTGRYYVVTGPKLVETVRLECLPLFNQNNCENAGVLIVTAFEKNRAGFSRDGVAENEVGQGWGCYDLGLQNQNLLLKATELGLDTLVMGIRDTDKLRKILQIPETQEVMAVIAVGYGQDIPEMPKRKEIQEIARFF